VETCKGTGDTRLLFLTMPMDGSEWSVSCPIYFTPGERIPVSN